MERGCHEMDGLVVYMGTEGTITARGGDKGGFSRDSHGTRSLLKAGTIVPESVDWRNLRFISGSILITRHSREYIFQCRDNYRTLLFMEVI